MYPQKVLFILLSAYCLLSCACAQQSVATKYYLDYDEKPIAQAKAIYWMIAYKQLSTDTIWQREMYYNRLKPVLVAKGLSKDSAGLIRQGSYTYKYDNGKLLRKGTFENNLKVNEWNEWDLKGKLIKRENYINGHLAGLCLSWNSEGKIVDSVILDNEGMGRGIGFYGSGFKRYTGNYSIGLKEGKWNYYFNDVQNKISMTADYSKDEAKTYTCFTAIGDIQTDDCIFEREASFKGEGQAWIAYLTKALQKVKPEKYLPGGSIYQVMLRFIIDSDGSVADVEIENPDNESLDTMAQEIIKKSPKWIPAVQYNQKVKAYRRQPLTFAVD